MRLPQSFRWLTCAGRIHVPRYAGPLAVIAVLQSAVPSSVAPEARAPVPRERELPPWAVRQSRAVAAHREHRGLLRVVERSQATHEAARSGAWTDPTIWHTGRVPGRHARVVIPRGVTVTVASVLLKTRLEWIRVDGLLRFAPDRDTGLKVETLVVTDTGEVEIGRPHARVRPDRTAVIEFADRGVRDRERDPLDLSGGLIAMGRVGIFGALMTGHVDVASPIRQGTSALHLRAVPVGWKRGQLLVVPGVNPWADEDEVVRIAGVDAARRWVVLARPLRYAHEAPERARIPVGNLSRNVVFRSANPRRLSGRAHFMIMHVKTGVVIDGAAFHGLGRTDTRIAHTFPVVDAQGRLAEGSDQNTIGRYAVHFHGRWGSRWSVPPHVFRQSVIVDSPKHGLVNHGGHVVAEGNVTFRIDGSHFFAENGREIGAFRRNLAIRSAGFGQNHDDDGVLSRMYMQDFGFDGFGYWLQGPGVELSDNYAFGHRAAGYAINVHMMREAGRLAFFAAANVRDPRLPRRGRIRPADLPFRFSRNQAAACVNGMEIWYSQIHAAHPVPSVVEDSFFWALSRHGVSMPYTRHVTFRNVTVIGTGTDLTTVGFGNTNNWADGMVFDNVRAAGFGVGVDMPTKGTNLIRRSHLANRRNIRIRNGPGRDLDVTCEDVTFDPTSAADFVMEGVPNFRQPEVRDGTQGFDRMLPLTADLSPLFGRVRVIVKDRRAGRPDRQVYFDEQSRDAKPFRMAGIPEIAGKTSGQVWDEYGLAIGGALAPAASARTRRVVGLIDPPTQYEPARRLVSPRYTKVLSGYVPRWQGDDGTVIAGPPTDLREGWNLVKGRARHPSALVFGDTSAPAFVRDDGFRHEIHPADLPFGLTVRGNVVDRVGALKARHLYVGHFHDLAAGPDGMLRIRFAVEDEVGNSTDVVLPMRVTRRAVRRGSNSIYYAQGAYAPSALPERAVAGW